MEKKEVKVEIFEDDEVIFTQFLEGRLAEAYLQELEIQAAYSEYEYDIID